MKYYQSKKVNEIFFDSDFKALEHSLQKRVLELVQSQNFTCMVCGFTGVPSENHPTGFMTIADLTGRFTKGSTYDCVCPFCLSYLNLYHSLSSGRFLAAYLPNQSQSSLSQLFSATLPLMHCAQHNNCEDARKIYDKYKSMSSELSSIFSGIDFFDKSPSKANNTILMTLAWYGTKLGLDDVTSFIKGIRLIPISESFVDFSRYYSTIIFEYSREEMMDQIARINSNE